MDPNDETLKAKGREVVERALRARLQATKERATTVLTRIEGLAKKMAPILEKAHAPDLGTMGHMMRLERAGEVGRARLADWLEEHGPAIEKALDAADPGLRADFPKLIGARSDSWSRGHLLGGHTMEHGSAKESGQEKTP